MTPLPVLFLNIEQGPKAGCRLECKAAAISTVGRGRANTLQISRDTGISQNHLRFQWISAGDNDGDANVGWTAIDEGSSNGTIINRVPVEPHEAISIHTGDLLKIGSETTIRVEILDVADEVKAVSKAKECSERKATCIASESHGRSMPVVVGRHARKAGRAAGKALAAQECKDKQLDVMEGEVYHGNHHIHNAVNEGHGKQMDDMTNEAYHGNQHRNSAKDHGKQQDEMADVVSGIGLSNSAAEGHSRQGCNMTAQRHRQDKQDINNEEEEGRNSTAHGVNNVGEGKQENMKTAKVSRDHEHETKFVATSQDIDLSMTVEQWFQHLMEEGSKYLYRVSEIIIEDVMLESKQFDEYVLSLC